MRNGHGVFRAAAAGAEPGLVGAVGAEPLAGPGEDPGGQDWLLLLLLLPLFSVN